MTPAMPVPQTEFTPYLLQQAGLRASLLQTSFGFAADDWDDMRQDLALDCLRRLPNFDPARGDWRQFVHGVVRNHSCNLASHHTNRPMLCSIVAVSCSIAPMLCSIAPTSCSIVPMPCWILPFSIRLFRAYFPKSVALGS